jgi:hypothetical protein
VALSLPAPRRGRRPRRAGRGFSHQGARLRRRRRWAPRSPCKPPQNRPTQPAAGRGVQHRLRPPVLGPPAALDGARGEPSAREGRPNRPRRGLADNRAGRPLPCTAGKLCHHCASTSPVVTACRAGRKKVRRARLGRGLQHTLRSASSGLEGRRIALPPREIGPLPSLRGAAPVVPGAVDARAERPMPPSATLRASD